MERFYFMMLPFVLLAAYSGYRSGFLSQFVFIINAAVALTAAFFLFPVLYNQFAMTQGFWTVLTFCILVLLLFAVSSFLQSRLFKMTSFHGHRYNRVCGAVAAAGVFILLLPLMAANTAFVKLPAAFHTALQQTGIRSAMAAGANWLNERAADMPGFSTTTVLSAENKNTDEHGAVKLSFKTTSVISRADLELQMLSLVNGERKKYGLKPLENDAALVKVARSHSSDMLARGYFDHNTPEGATPFDRMHKAKVDYHSAGENLAMSATLARAHENLMNSPGHRANILRASYGKVGIGIMDAGEYGLMISQEFRD